MSKFYFNCTAALWLLKNLVYFSLVPNAMGTIDNSFQNSQHFQSTFPINHQHLSDFDKRHSNFNDGTNGKITNDGYQQPGQLPGTPHTAQAVVAVVQAVNTKQKHSHQPSSEMIRSNSNNGNGNNRRCTYFENGEMRCTSRGDVLDSVSMLANQAISLAGQLGGIAGIASQLGGLAGLMGLLGLKGIAGLILPLLCLFLLKFLLILLPLKLLIPIPIISLPFAGRRSLHNTGYKPIEEKIASVFKQFIESDEIIDKVSSKDTQMRTKENLITPIEIKRPNYKKSTEKFLKEKKI